MITITIRTENGAFQDREYNNEVAHILRRMSDEYANGYARMHGPTAPRDICGNTVGTVTLTGKDRARMQAYRSKT